MALSHVFLVLNFMVFVIANEKSIEHEKVDSIRTMHFAGYEAQAHRLITEDGYMLEIHRIPCKRYQKYEAANRPVVLLMHGLLRDSRAFIALGPQYSIAYNLADAGFDVWLGNARGTVSSRQHIMLNLDKPVDKIQFFNFTWEEIGYFDLANTVDYITLHTGVEKIHFIGHGQGGTIFLVLNSMRPEYNHKFKSAHLLAPVGYQKHFPNVVLLSKAKFCNTILTLTQKLKIVELFPPLSKISRTENESAGEKLTYMYDCDNVQVCRLAEFCTGNPLQKDICELLGVKEIMSGRVLQTTDIEPGGAATKQIAHFGQNIQDQAFRRWNYGPMGNFELYGVSQPPIYNLSLISVPVTMHYTVSDNLVDEMDIKAMAADLQNAKVRRVERDSFLHVDFLAAGDVRQLVTVYMIEEIIQMHGKITTKDSSAKNQTVVTPHKGVSPIYLDVPGKLPGCHRPTPSKPGNTSSFPVFLDFQLKVYLVINLSYLFCKHKS